MNLGVMSTVEAQRPKPAAHVPGSGLGGHHVTTPLVILTVTSVGNDQQVSASTCEERPEGGHATPVWACVRAARTLMHVCARNIHTYV